MRLLPVIAILSLLLAAAPASAQVGDDSRETYKAAVYQLKQATQFRRNSDYNMLLRSLRHLEDPQLAPLFSQLVESRYPQFKIHGILGLAECDPDNKIDLARVAAIEDPADQAQVISAAMDSELLSDEQVKQIIDWPGLDLAIKVLVSSQLISAGKFDQPQVLLEAAESDNLARRYLAKLMLAQIGDAEAYKQLDELHTANDPSRDAVREMLIRTALRYELDRIGRFALHVAADTDLSRRDRLDGLKAAVRFNAPGAADLWRQQWASATDMAHRTRLGLIALQLSPWIAPELFDPVIADENELIRQLGRTGRAVAAKDDIAGAMRDLIDMDYPLANTWTLGYALYESTEADALAIGKAIIQSGMTDKKRGRAQRLDDAVSTTEMLLKRVPDQGAPFLRGILADPNADTVLKQAIMLGLVRTRDGEPHKVIQGLTFEQSDIQDLALVIRARHNDTLTADELRQLGLLVRGGGRERAPLRIQAGWLYLSLTNQTGPALAEVISR